MKKWILLVALSISALQWSACTSTDTQDETEVAVDDTAAVDGELERIDGLDSDTLDTADASSEGFLDEQLPADALGETVAQDTPVEEVPASEAFASEPVAEEPLEPVPQDSFAATDTSSDTSSAPVDSFASSADSTSETPSFDSTSSFDSAATSTPVADAAPAAPPAPLRKIDSVPRMGSDGKPLNAVYIARPGDNFGKISERIYGDRSKLGYLRAENSFVKTVRPGSKIYYNSPARPDDSSRVLTYFEDQGMMPEVYVAQEGDNIRKVSENLLGYDRAWMEIWSTNPVESKQEIAAGTELRYWKNMPAPAVSDQTTLAGVSNTPPPMDPAMDLPPPPPPADMAAMDLPPPPPPMDPAMDLPPPPPPADMAAMDLPPPPPAEALNPPPPPPAPKKATASAAGGDQDLMTALGAGAILVAGIALLMIIRKRKQKKELEAAFNDTQVGT